MYSRPGLCQCKKWTTLDITSVVETRSPELIKIRAGWSRKRTEEVTMIACQGGRGQGRGRGPYACCERLVLCRPTSAAGPLPGRPVPVQRDTWLASERTWPPMALDKRVANVQSGLKNGAVPHVLVHR